MKSAQEPTKATGTEQSIYDIISMQDDIEFLKAIVARYPETRALAQEAEATPEGGTANLKKDAMAYAVFEEQPEQTAIEADRTFMGLKLFKAAYNNDKSLFPHLTAENFAELHSMTHATVKNAADLESIMYALACNDLGKTSSFIGHGVRLTGKKAPDHDQLLAEVVERAPELFPGMSRLDPEYQKMYLEGLKANLNLGQFVQGENLPCNLTEMQAISPKARNLRLLTEIFDFAGATGHINKTASILMNNDNYYAYKTASEELMKEPLDQAYYRYMADRGYKAGVLDSNNPEDLMADPEKIALARIVALSRSFTKDQGALIKETWEGLDEERKEILTKELSESGKDNTGILLYYSPALITNTLNGEKNEFRRQKDLDSTKPLDKDQEATVFKKALKASLEVMSDCYQTVRENPEINLSGPGVYTYNVNDIAKEAAKGCAALKAAALVTNQQIKFEPLKV